MSEHNQILNINPEVSGHTNKVCSFLHFVEDMEGVCICATLRISLVLIGFGSVLIYLQVLKTMTVISAWKLPVRILRWAGQSDLKWVLVLGAGTPKLDWDYNLEGIS